MFELMVAAKLLMLAPKSDLGTDRVAIEKLLGTPLGVGTDWIGGRGDDHTDRIVTLDWTDIRVRLYESPATNEVKLIGVTLTKDLLPTHFPVRVGVDRGTVLRELGGPAFEDENQIIYSLRQESAERPNETMRLVFRDDRVIGIDWTYPLNDVPEPPARATADSR